LTKISDILFHDFPAQFTSKVFVTNDLFTECIKFHSWLSLQSPVGDRGAAHETSSVHDETSSSGNKEDDDDDDDDSEDKIDSQQYDPERLKAFNVSVIIIILSRIQKDLTPLAYLPSSNRSSRCDQLHIPQYIAYRKNKGAHIGFSYNFHQNLCEIMLICDV
jgi:hypothetical protein